MMTSHTGFTVLDANYAIDAGLSHLDADQIVRFSSFKFLGFV